MAMQKKMNRKINIPLPAAVGVGLAALLVLGFLGLRLYANLGNFDFSYMKVSAWEYKKEEGTGILELDSDRRVLTICLSEDAINTLLARQHPGTVLRLAEGRLFQSLAHWTGRWPVSAAVRIETRQECLGFILTDFRLGTGEIEIPRALAGEEEELVLEIEDLLPSWLRLAGAELRVDGLLIETDILLPVLKEKLAGLLAGIRKSYLDIAAREPDNAEGLIPETAEAFRTGQISDELALALLEDFVTDRSELYRLLPLLEPETAAGFLEEQEAWLSEEFDASAFVKKQAEYEMEARSRAARWLWQRLRQETGTEEGEAWPLYGAQGTPYSPSSGILYDSEWILNHHALPEAYACYAEELRLYFNNQTGELTVIAELNETQALLLQEDQYRVENKEQLALDCPGWDSGAERPAQPEKGSPEAQALTDLLKQQYGVQTVHIRFLATAEQEAFAVFSLEDEKKLRSVLFRREAEWQIAEEMITDYRAYLRDNPGTNGLLFPEYSVAEVTDKPLSASAMNQLVRFLKTKKALTGRETVAYCSYIGRFLYLQTSGGAERVVRLNEKGLPAECLPVQEAREAWELPPFLTDVL